MPGDIQLNASLPDASIGYSLLGQCDTVIHLVTHPQAYTMKLLLTSNGLITPTIQAMFYSLIGKPPSEIRALFVPTAADPESDKDFVVSARSRLTASVGRVIEFDIATATPEQFTTALENVDVLYVNGGNTFYLLHMARTIGMASAVARFLARGGLYCGSSAGSILATPSIEVALLKGYDDPTIVPHASLEGFRLVPFFVFAHYSAQWKELVAKEIVRLDSPLIALRDCDAIAVSGSDYTLINQDHLLPLPSVSYVPEV
jgi:dipeptidase E